MWDHPVKKTLFTLNVNDYAPEITELTYPFLEFWAKKIGADFHIISERKWPDYVPVYEKLQIYELAQQQGNTWNIYVDSDTFIMPDMMDVTRYTPPNVVLFTSCDNAGVRFGYDRFFERDGRHLGAANWFTVASYQNIELWKPLDDISYEEALTRLLPTCGERASGISYEHIIDDFVLSRNIAKYGLKVATLKALHQQLEDQNVYLWHKYTISCEEKRRQLCQTIKMAGCLDLLPVHLQDDVYYTRLDGANTQASPMPEVKPKTSRLGILQTDGRRTR